MLKPGDSLDRYTIEAVLGEGGMGTVYRAYDARLRRRVALKVLRPDANTKATASERLVREARAAASLDHPNAVAIFDVGEVDGAPYIAMELVLGKNLRSYVGQASVPMSQRLQWLLDVARALAAAHKAGLVHRDVKPENVMVREDGAVKVLDFGIARRSANGETPSWRTITEKGVAIGTPLYMAPEQLRGETVDGRTDQFAWAVLAYEILTGRVPWDAQDLMGLSAAIASQRAEPPSRHVPGLPPLVDEIVLRALAKEPDARFATMDDVITTMVTLTTDGGGWPLSVRPAPSGEDVNVLARTEITPSAPPPAATRTATPYLTTTNKKEKQEQRENKTARRKSVALAAIAAVGLAAAAIVGTRTPAAPRNAGAPAPADAAIAASDAAVTLTDLPVGSTVPAARAAYMQGMQALRDGNWGLAHTSFEHAAESDPNWGQAQLRRALTSYGISGGAEESTRRAFQRAVQLRATLDERDQALLDAYEPIVGGVADTAEMIRRLHVAAARFPRDAEFAETLAYLQLDIDPELALADVTRAIALDPKMGDALEARGKALAYLGRNEEAFAAFEQCTRISATSTDCLMHKCRLDAIEGRVDDLVRDAKRLSERDPGPAARRHLAVAMIAAGEGSDAAREALRHSWALMPEGREGQRKADEAELAILDGELGRAADLAQERLALLSTVSDARQQFISYRHLLGVLVEMGEVERARRVAKEYLGRRSAWMEFADVGATPWFPARRDPFPSIMAFAVRTKLLAADVASARRDRWLHAQNGHQGYIWAVGYAEAVETRAEAEEALRALAGKPQVLPLTGILGAPIGHTYLLADRVDEAIPHLRKVAASGLAFGEALLHTQAQGWLGDALAAKDDKAAACAAYAKLLVRWGHAKPRSVSADHARERMKALACPR